MIADCLAFVAIVVAIAAPLCGHQTQPFPPLVWWRNRRRRAWPRSRPTARRIARNTRP
ncbi:hypothetical protein [Streptomyces sp. NPDC007110]|uniref:hypothetical protein n=1 Tax=Streptomyces sp. NPDC007110 TaxID=3156916 RepID=UPI0033DB1C0F